MKLSGRKNPKKIYFIDQYAHVAKFPLSEPAYKKIYSTHTVVITDKGIDVHPRINRFFSFKLPNIFPFYLVNALNDIAVFHQFIPFSGIERFIFPSDSEPVIVEFKTESKQTGSLIFYLQDNEGFIATIKTCKNFVTTTERNGRESLTSTK